MAMRRGIENLSFRQTENINEYLFNLNNVTYNTKGQYRCRFGYKNKISNELNINDVYAYHTLECVNTPTFKCSSTMKFTSSVFVMLVCLFIAFIVLD